MTRFNGLRPAVLGLSMAMALSACVSPTQTHNAPAAGATPAATPDVASPITPRVAAAADVLNKMAALQDRLYRVAAPLLIQNADLCKDKARNLLGFTAKNRHSYPGEYNEAAHLVLGMGERLQVTGVLAGSGASRAGLERGDRLLSAGGKPLPVGRNASTMAGAVFGPLVRKQASLPMVVERDGGNRQLDIPVTRACGFAVELGNADNVNSYADGARVMVTRGMMQFARTDRELAYVMAKAIAHNMLGHVNVQRNAGTIGSMIDNLMNVRPDQSLLIGSGGIRATPPELDAAADSLSLYLLARAGYDIEPVDEFWKKLAAAHPATVLNGYVANHPGTAARLAAIQKTGAEIRAKQSSKRALVP
ncbi:M48 family metallopeptidase [Massilia glaciei]|uniref:Peptidase M48 n=1 Tax=Massilia glaciei TaxID=1524097 RepID=A0A2U2HHR1_9BURK|nr:M48 family metallopeptidase [Massilia glaciei]PWF45460.1 peptidase M48 [Massilia glaciei]